MPGPCSELTVLDFSTGMPGALTTAVLADYGAELIKVEPPSGDPFRNNSSWLAWNRGKKGIVLDLTSIEGREQAQQMAARADILVESFRPGDTEGFGIDYETVSKINPHLVYCSITGFGQKGRLRRLKAYEGIVAAKSGRMAGFTGQSPREGPFYPAVETATWSTSQAAVRGILAALRIRASTGKGQWVQTSLLQGMMCYVGGRIMDEFFSRKDPVQFPPNVTAAERAIALPTLEYIPVRTKDGRWLQHANNAQNPRLVQAHLRAIGLDWIFEDERFMNVPRLTEENRELLRELILERMQEKTLAEWMDIYVKDGNVAAEPFIYTAEAMDHPQFVHNKHVVEIDDPRVGPMKIVGLVADLSNSPGEVGGPAPNIGQHTSEIVASMAERQPLSLEEGTDGSDGPRHPLDNITVLDFSTVIQGPYGASMIADLGARVIKVDATPERGSPRRVNQLGNLRTYAGKECIQVDMQTPEGQEFIHRLITKTDVLLHNFRPGVPERLGIDYETCRKINPRLVWVYSGAYGATGPHNRRPGAHPLPGALFGGALRQAGRSMTPLTHESMTMDEIKETSRRLMRANEGNPDPNTSQAVATAIMLGLWDRERTGMGQSIQDTMMIANAWANHKEAYNYTGRPSYAIPDRDSYGLHALYRLYPAKEGWVFFACLFDEEWSKFCHAVGRKDLLGDPRFAPAARQAHDEELVEQLSNIFATLPADKWENMLTAEDVDVACVRVMEAGEEEFLLDDPHSLDNDFAVETEDENPRFGSYMRPGGIVQFSGMAGRFRTAPYVGQHTRSIMHEVGYSDAEVDDYHERRIVDWQEVEPMFTKG